MISLRRKGKTDTQTQTQTQTQKERERESERESERDLECDLILFLSMLLDDLTRRCTPRPWARRTRITSAPGCVVVVHIPLVAPEHFSSSLAAHTTTHDTVSAGRERERVRERVRERERERDPRQQAASGRPCIGQFVWLPTHRTQHTVLAQ